MRVRVVWLVVLAVVLCLPALGHDEHIAKSAPTSQAASLTWTWDPLILSLLIVSASLYLVGASRSRTTLAQRSAYLAGWLILCASLVSPIHRLGEVLFAAHMTQHELLMLLAAPLLVMGRPLAPFLFALPQGWRHPVGALTQARWIGFMGKPLVAWLAHAAVLWGWHTPYLYQAAVRSDLVHALQHSSFLFSAILFWWTLIHGRYGRMGYGVGVFYVFSTAVHSSILGALLTFATQLWYPIYAERTALWRMTPLQDQQMGGLIMWVPAGAIFLVVGLALFAAWLGESERRVLLSQTEALRGAGLRPGSS